MVARLAVTSTSSTLVPLVLIAAVLLGLGVIIGVGLAHKFNVKNASGPIMTTITLFFVFAALIVSASNKR